MKFLSDILAKAGLTVDGVVTLNNTATGQTPASNDNSTKLATTAWVRTFVQPYSLPIASTSILGGIKVGTGLSIDAGSGILSVTGGGAASIKSTQTFTATAAQTVFTITGGYSVGLIDVFLNGVYLSPNQTTATNGTSITLGDAALAGDIIDVIVASPVYEGATTTTDQLSEGTTNLYFTNARARAAISLTTTGTSGAATYTSGVLNIPQYQGVLTNPVTGTGTTNYLPKFTGASTIGNSQIFDNGTNVGIGTITPLGILHLFVSAATTRMLLDGNAGQSKIITYRTNGLQRFGLYVNNTAESGSNVGSDFQVRAYNDAGTLLSTPLFIKRSTGNVGVNTITPAYQLDVNGTGRISGVLTLSSTISNGTYTYTLPSATGTLALTSELSSYVPTSRTLTINGTTYDLTANRTWTLTTANISEVTNLYYTDARARAAISVTGSGSYDSATGVITVTGGVTSVNTLTGAVVLTTTNIAEGTNLYYTQARFDTAFTAKSTTNLTEGTNLYYTTARANADFDTRLATKSTTNLSEGTNLYYTDTRVGTYLTNNSYATQTYVNTAVSNLVDAAPGTLDTLNELAAALGDDPNFATTVATSIGTKEPAITAGTTGQYWRGDKSWQTLPIYTLSGLGGVPTTRTITINGTAQDLSADRTFTINSMVYPGAGIALSTGSAWGTSITDNSANWNTAFGWGNHASGGYLTTALAATTYASLTGAYANPAFVASLAWSKITGAPAFITSYTEVDTLATVTGRGNSTTSSITVNGDMNSTGIVYSRANQTTSYTTAALWTQSFGSTLTGIAFHISGVVGRMLYMNTTDANLYWNGTALVYNSGTWSINVTGNAATATNVAYSGLTGTVPTWNQNTTGSAATAGSSNFLSLQGTANLRTITSAGIYREEQPDSGFSYTTTLNMNSSDGRQQLTIERGGGGMKFRGSTSGSGDISWSDWRNVWHSSNLTNLNQLTNGPGYITGYTETDTLATVTARGATTTSTIIINGGVVHPLAISSSQRYQMQVRNTSNSINSGYGWWWFMDTNFNMGFHADGASDRFTLTRDGNLSVSGTLSGSNLSGTNTGDQTNISGYSASVIHSSARTDSASYNVVWAAGNPSQMYSCDAVRIQSSTGTIFATRSSAPMSATVADGNWDTSFSNTPVSTMAWGGDISAGGPTGTWWFQMNMRHSNASNLWGTQLAYGWEDNANQLYQRNVTGGSWSGWVRYLNSGNYNSYAPTLTGTGASGTWGISITGNAGSVSGLTLTSSANGINPDSVTQNQIGYNTSVSLFGQTDGGLYSSAYSSNWIHQIYGDFRTGQIAIRGKQNGTWQAWRTVWDSSNLTNLNQLTNGPGYITSSGSISGTASNITAYTINQSVGTGNSPTFAGLTVSGPVYQGLSNQGVISLLSDVVVGQTNNYFRLYLPQGYYDNRNGGTATIKIVWGMLHAGVTYSQEYKLTFGTNHGAGGNYLHSSQVTKTYSDQNPESYGGYLMDQTPSVDFYHDMSGGYINFNVKGYQSYNTHRVVAVDIVGGGVGTPTLTYYGASSPGGSALTVKDIPYASTAGSANSVAWTNVSSRPTALSSFTNDVALPLNGNWVGNTGMNDQKLYLRTNGDNNHYIWNAADDWEEIVAYFGTGLRIAASNATTLATFTTSGLTVTGAISTSGALTVAGTTTLNTQVNINRHIDANTGWGSASGNTIFVGWNGGKVVLGSNANGGHDYASGIAVASVVSTNPFFCFQDITAYSDARVKDNIQIVENAVEKIKAIRGVTYTRSDNVDKVKRHAGVLAQEVLKVLPEVVNGSEDSVYSVAYGNMAALFIEAIKEQQTQIESQKSEIDELKDLVQQLINR
jgi:hypothetical protein